MTPYTPPEPACTVSPYEVNTIFWEAGHEYAGLSSTLFTEAQLRSEVERVRRETVEECARKPNCTECAKWSQEQADNREWIEGVAEGRRIVEKLAAKESLK